MYCGGSPPPGGSLFPPPLENILAIIAKQKHTTDNAISPIHASGLSFPSEILAIKLREYIISSFHCLAMQTTTIPVNMANIHFHCGSTTTISLLISSFTPYLLQVTPGSQRRPNYQINRELVGTRPWANTYSFPNSHHLLLLPKNTLYPSVPQTLNSNQHISSSTLILFSHHSLPFFYPSTPYSSLLLSYPLSSPRPSWIASKSFADTYLSR